MTYSVFKNIKIKGIAGVVPRHKIDNLIAHIDVDQDKKEKIIKLTGVNGYRKTSKDICSSDLCQKAAENLLIGLNIDSGQIDAIIFVTQSPDYRTPATSCILQNKLHCSISTLSIDINSGCAGFIQGLYTACAFINGGGVNRVLLLCGDTQTKLINEADNNVNFILGDGGTATLLEAAPQASDICISLYTDGSRYDKLIIPAGGCRIPSSTDTRKIETQPDGEQRSQEHLFMDGMAVFNFSATDVVQSIIDFMEKRKLIVTDIDYLFLHQANKFLTDKIAKKLGFPPNKVPYSLGKFGNTSCASIPLTIVDHFQNNNNKNKRCLLVGFGVGLSWGVVDIFFDEIYAPPIGEI